MNKNFFIFYLNKSPALKKSLLQLLDFYDRYAPFLVGNLLRNPAYLRHRLNSKVIAKPRLFSFGAIFNPGVLLVDHKIVLLANAQKLPWFKARGAKAEFYMTGNPLLTQLALPHLSILNQNIITTITDLPSDQDYAIEDFRLFRWQGKNMINHSLVLRKKTDGFIGQAGVFSALSVLDPEEKTFKFCGLPQVDFPHQNFEKNWVYKENGLQLFLFYSLNPYKVLVLTDEKSFSFKTVLNQQFSSKINDPGGFGTLVSFSTNPIDYDDKHWLLVIHQIQHRFTGRCYYHWIVLIDRSSLMPVKITSKPIFSGMGARGRTPGIRYISSVLKIDQELLFFAGEGDVCVTVTWKSVASLQKLWVDL